MKSRILIALTLGALSACEGEPPKTAAEVPEAPTAQQQQTPTPPPAETDEAHQATGGNCCNCGCAKNGATVAAAGDGGAPLAVDDGGAAAQHVATTDAAAPAAAGHADIVGTVVTTPAYLSSAAVVWLEDAPKEPGKGMHARIDNHQMTFAPMVQVITAGGTVSFVNADPFPHNVFSTDGDKFNMGSIPQNSTASRKFDKAGTYTLLCNLHPGMLGYLVVAPSSYYARANTPALHGGGGHYRIKDVPAGTYKITAWAPRLPTVTQSVTVGEAEAKVDFELHR